MTVPNDLRIFTADPLVPEPMAATAVGSTSAAPAPVVAVTAAAERVRALPTLYEPERAHDDASPSQTTKTARSALPVLEHVSLSRLRRRLQCERMDWWQTEGAKDGWRQTARPETRLAYALKKLTSWPGVVGDAIHQAAAVRARALRDGRRPPDYAQLLDLVRARLNAAACSRDVERFLRDPSHVVMLREVYSGEWPAGRIPADVVATTKTRVGSLLRRMLAHPVWEDIARCGRGDILVCDALDALALEVDGVPVKVYAAPDLVWVSHEPVLLPDFGVPVVPPVVSLLDWKTGRGDGRVDAARDQLALYAWWASQKLDLPAGLRGFVGRVADLGAADTTDGDVQFVLRPEDLTRAGRQLERAIRGIAAARDPDGVVSMDDTRRNLEACRWCSFTPLCLRVSQGLTA